MIGKHRVESRRDSIIFTAESVLAILSGRKTQTRRIMKRAIDEEGNVAWGVFPARDSGWVAWFGQPMRDGAEFTKKAYIHGFECPYGKVGDRLFVKETWIQVYPTGTPGQWSCIRPSDFKEEHGKAFYKAGCNDPVDGPQRQWNSPMFMPRWASRITLEITALRAERVQDISEEDALAEGIQRQYLPDLRGNRFHWGDPTQDRFPTAVDAYRALWDSINAKRGFPFEKNNWVWAVSHKMVEADAN